MLTMRLPSTFRRIFLLWLLFAVSLPGGVWITGCDSADYTVIKSVKSPDGNSSALLVRRRGHDSLSSDVYYVILTSGNTKTANLSKSTRNDAILVATHGQGLGIQWSGNNTLNIVCADCGIRPIDIMEKKGSEGGFRIVYVGFANGTAVH
jgi:hypothetical protein